MRNRFAVAPCTVNLLKTNKVYCSKRQFPQVLFRTTQTHKREITWCYRKPIRHFATLAMKPSNLKGFLESVKERVTKKDCISTKFSTMRISCSVLNPGFHRLWTSKFNDFRPQFGALYSSLWEMIGTGFVNHGVCLVYEHTGPGLNNESSVAFSCKQTLEVISEER